MPRYGLLKRTHAEYDADLFQELEDLYEGGYQIEKNAKRYLNRLANETLDAYNDRVRSAAFLPYLGQIADQLSAWLFADDLSVLPAADAENPDTPGKLPDGEFYGDFAKNADLTGRGFSDCIRALVAPALVKRRALVGIDFPQVSAEDRDAIVTRKDEDEQGAARAYLVDIPIEQVINWDRNADGSFKWVVINRATTPLEGPLDPGGKVVEDFKVWSVQANDKGENVVRWDLYRITYSPEKPPKEKTEVPLVDGGETSFTEIPIVELLLPKGLWVGNKIGTLNKEHWRRRATLNGSQEKSLYELAVVKLGSEIGAPHQALPSIAQQNPARGNDPVAEFKSRGALVIGADDEFDFKGPSGVAFKVVDEQLSNLKDEIFRVVHLMAAAVSNNKTGAINRSGESKQQDKADTAIVLNALGSATRLFATRIYTVISKARDEDVVWSPKGLDDFQVDDRQEVLEEALQVDAIGIPSPTWKASYKTRLAFKLEPGLPPETQATIRGEIRDGVQHETEMADLATEALRQQAKGGDEPDGDEPPEGGGKAGSGGKPPKPGAKKSKGI